MSSQVKIPSRQHVNEYAQGTNFIPVFAAMVNSSLHMFGAAIDKSGLLRFSL